MFIELQIWNNAQITCIYLTISSSKLMYIIWDCSRYWQKTIDSQVTVIPLISASLNCPIIWPCMFLFVLYVSTSKNIFESEFCTHIKLKYATIPLLALSLWYIHVTYYISCLMALSYISAVSLLHLYIFLIFSHAFYFSYDVACTNKCLEQHTCSFILGQSSALLSGTTQTDISLRQIFFKYYTFLRIVWWSVNTTTNNLSQ